MWRYSIISFMNWVLFIWDDDDEDGEGGDDDDDGIV